jgi:hypothetical protein
MRTVKSSISPKSTLKTGGTVTAKKALGSGAVTPHTTVQNTGIFQNLNRPSPLPTANKPKPNLQGSKRGKFTS